MPTSHAQSIAAGSRDSTGVSVSRLSHAVRLIELVCRIAGARDLILDAVTEHERAKLTGAIKNHDNGYLFDWLMRAFSFQGVSDRVAAEYLRRNGSVTWRLVEANLRDVPSCPRLKNYWAFDQCGYDKGSSSCREPEHIESCPLPQHPLRNGRLNQTAYSLFLFMRDIAAGDLIAWLDTRVAEAKSDPNLAIANLLDPLRNIFGVSDKVLCMSFSTLLVAVGEVKPEWVGVGTRMIAVDTLVHNFLHRSGILTRLNATHPYGPRCYAPGHCADILRAVSGRIDARQFNPAYPTNFPRFVQHAPSGATAPAMA
jgi:hypothetical protein